MITIYHNPRCSKSRQTLELLNLRGIQANIRLYLEQHLSADELLDLLTMLNMTADQLVRKSEQYFKDNLRGKTLTQDQLIKIMVENPKLIERPIVVTGNKAAIGRPPEAVLEIIE
jgi:arsenate reductase